MIVATGRLLQGLDLEDVEGVASGAERTDIWIGVAILAATWPVAWVIGWATRRFLKRFSIPEYVGQLAGRLARTMISLIGIAAAMSSFGVDIGWFTVVLAFGAVVAFLMLRPLVENFSAGLLLQTRNSFGVGDEIEVEGHIGEILEVNGRSTVLRTRDGRRIHIPSTDVIENTITMYTAFDGRRSSLEIGVDDRQDIDVVTDALVKALTEVDEVFSDPPPSVLANGFGNGTVLLEVVWWHGPRLSESSHARDRVVRKLREAMDATEIMMPPPVVLIGTAHDDCPSPGPHGNGH